MAASYLVNRMFEEKAEEKEIYDFTLGNPEIETPAKFTEELRRTSIYMIFK
jgi:aspartate/methionine/tyrosine aminotransferase